MAAASTGWHWSEDNLTQTIPALQASLDQSLHCQPTCSCMPDALSGPCRSQMPLGPAGRMPASLSKALCSPTLETRCRSTLSATLSCVLIRGWCKKGISKTA